MTGLKPLMRKEVQEQISTFRLLLVAGLYFLVGFSSPLTTWALPAMLELARERGNLYLGIGLTSEPSIRDALSTYHNNFGLLSILAILIFMGAVVGERSRGTMALLLTKPISRGAILTAKIVSYSATFILGQVVGLLGFLLGAAIFFTMPPVGAFLEMNLYLLLAILLYGVVTFLGSVLFRSRVGAAVLGFMAMVSMTAFDQIPPLRRYTPAGMNDAIKSIVASGNSGDRTLSAWITLLLIVLSLVEAFRRFRKQHP